MRAWVAELVLLPMILGACVPKANPGASDASTAVDARPSLDASAPGGDAAAPSADVGPAADATPGNADAAPSGADASSPGSRTCADPDPAWLYCEDFERGAGDFDAWYSSSEFLDSPGAGDRGRVTLASDEVHGGGWALHLPAAASSGYQGAGMDWYACDGAPRTNCPLRSFDELYFRVWVRFAPDHRYIHHFLSIDGSQPDDFWYHGTAGCLPNGSLAMGTTVDYREATHESFFYTYFPEMGCDTRCDRYADVAQICADCETKGLPTCTQQPQCCWGNIFEPTPAVAYPVGQWFCLELMMRANTPSMHDGVMEYWIDGRSGHRQEQMMWRTSPTLALNRVRLQHYIETSDAQGFSNRVWFDDMVVSTSRIGCN